MEISDRQDLPQPATGDSSTPVTKHRIWAMHCPFKESGSPVLGTFGYTERGVIIIPIETWNALCREIPELARTQFEVGGYE